jgi:hypothetical protein
MVVRDSSTGKTRAVPSGLSRPRTTRGIAVARPEVVASSHRLSGGVGTRDDRVDQRSCLRDLTGGEVHFDALRRAIDGREASGLPLL